jgi:hypothetical protein
VIANDVASVGRVLLARLPRLLVALPLVVAALVLSVTLARATADAAWIDLVTRVRVEQAEWDCSPGIGAALHGIEWWAPEDVQSRIPSRWFHPDWCQ